MTPDVERPPGGGNRGAAQQIGRAGLDRQGVYRTLLADRLTAVALVLEALVAQRPEVDEQTLADVRERLVARAVAGADRVEVGV